MQTSQRKLNREHIPAPESSAQKLRKVKSKKGQLNSELDTGWTNGRIAGMIRNERYTGDVLVQKSYTADYLSHEVRKNKGEVQQYYIKDHHPAIVSRELFEKVQKDRQCKIGFAQERGKNTVGFFRTAYLRKLRTIFQCKK